MSQDYYDALIHERGAAEAAVLLADECRKKDQALAALHARGWDGCEWDPAANRLARSTDQHFRTTPAVVIIGSHITYRLCDNCAALPRFARITKRTRIGQRANEEMDVRR